jgi:hypothetical protein
LRRAEGEAYRIVLTQTLPHGFMVGAPAAAAIGMARLITNPAANWLYSSWRGARSWSAPARSTRRN